MAAPRKPTEPIKQRRPPATTPEARENQLIALAVDVAEQQMRDGTASAQVITHFIKLGSSRERLEQKRLEQETFLMAKKVEAMATADRTEEMYKNALAAISTYQGRPTEERFDD